jgi:hypothetical protein
MDLWVSFWFMMVSSFVVQMSVMSLIMTNSYSDITFSVGKFYMATIMALLMGALEVLMYDIHMRTLSLAYYLAIFFLLVVFIYLYRNQVYVSDKDYLLEMIEHHSMALLTSDARLDAELSSPRVQTLAKNIKDTQTREIAYMKQLIQ